MTTNPEKNNVNLTGNKRFYDAMLKGNVYKDMVRLLLEESGYIVYPYGYESTFSHVRSRLTKNSRNSKTVRRIRSSPDLLVHDEQKEDLMLVEIKMRTRVPPEIKPRQIDNYKEFWNDAILVLVVPCENVFYAQKVSELEVKERYYPLSHFEKLQDVFTKVKEETISHYRDKVIQGVRER